MFRRKHHLIRKSKFIAKRWEPDQGQSHVVVREVAGIPEVGDMIEVWTPALSEEEANQLALDRNYHFGPRRPFSFSFAKQTKRHTIIRTFFGIDR